MSLLKFNKYHSRFLSLGEYPSKAEQYALLHQIQQAIKNGDINAKNCDSHKLMLIQKILVFSLNSGGTGFKSWKQHFWGERLNLKKPKRRKSDLSGLVYDISQKQKAAAKTQPKNNAEPIDRNAIIKKPKDIAMQEYNFFNTGKFSDLLGTTTLPFSLMITGVPGSGKTTFFLQLIKHTSNNYPNKKILFISNEERFNPSMGAKLKRFNMIENENIDIADRIPPDLYNYSFIFFDSVQSLRLSVDEFKQKIEDLMKSGICLFFVFQATKSGQFRGSLEYEHEVDISLKAKAGQVSVEKNRFGGSGKYTVF